MNPGPTLRQRTRRGLFWAGGEAFARTLLQTGVLAILSRLLTPDDYGVVGAALIVVGVSAIFSQLGVGPAIVQRQALEPKHLDAAFTLSIVFGLVTAGAVWLAAPAITAFFAPNDPQMQSLTPTLRWLCVLFPIGAISVVSESLLLRDLRFDLIARSEVWSYFVGFGCVAVILAWCGWGIWALVCGHIVQMLMRTEMLFACITWRPRASCRRSAMRDLFRFSAGLTVARLLNYIATNGDNVVVGRVLGANALGVYGRAYQIMSHPANLIGNVLDKVLFPALAKVQDCDKRLGRVYRQGVGLLASIMLPASAMIYLLAPEIVHVLLGPKWTGVIFPLQIFSVALLFRTGMKISNTVIRARGQVYEMAGCQLMYATTTVGFAWLGRAWGIEGVCYGVLCSILLCFFVCAALCLRSIRMSWMAFLGEHLPGVWLATAVYAVGWAVLGTLRASHAQDWFTLLAGSSAMTGIALLIVLFSPLTFLGESGVRIQDGRRRFFLRFTRMAQ